MREKLDSSKELKNHSFESAKLPEPDPSARNRLEIRKLRGLEESLKDHLLSTPLSAVLVLRLIETLKRGEIARVDLFARQGSEKVIRPDGSVEPARKKTGANTRLKLCEYRLIALGELTRQVRDDFVRDLEGANRDERFSDWRARIQQAELSTLAFQLMVDSLRNNSSRSGPIPNLSQMPDARAIIDRYSLPPAFVERGQALCQEIDCIRGQLVSANMGLVGRLTRLFWRAGIDRDDLRQEATIGLLHAIDAYDPDVGANLSTFANFKIVARILRCIGRSAGPQVRLSAQVHEGIGKVKRLEAQSPGSVLNEEEISKLVGVGPKTASLIREFASMTTFSLDRQALSSRGSQALHELVVGASEAGDGILRDDGLGQAVEKALGRLRPKQRLVIKCLYFEALSLRETAALMQLSTTRIRMLEREALSRLRVGRNVTMLGDYADNRPGVGDDRPKG